MRAAHLRRLPVLLLVAAVLTGCGGGSVADLDRPRESRTAAVPDSPFCSAVQRSGEALVEVTRLAARGSATPQELTDTIVPVRQANQQVAATAPQDIRPDVDVYLRSMDLQLDALVASGGNGAALAQDTELAAQLNTPEAQRADRTVGEYIAANCSVASGRG